MPDQPMTGDPAGGDALSSATWMQKLGGVASFLMAVAFIVAPLIYLAGNLRAPYGPFTYSLADFLYGPVWAASLVTAVTALRERTGERAARLTSLALLAAALAAGAMLSVALMRSANRQYHLMHLELHLEESTTVLVVWTTLVAGVSATGWHLLGWAWVLLGAAGWSSRGLPRALCVLYWVGGVAALFVYLLPEAEGAGVLLGVGISIWQGILLWQTQHRYSGSRAIE